MTFGEALQLLREGKCVKREAWRNKAIFIVDGEFWMDKTQGAFRFTSRDPFVLSCDSADILALDWIETEMQP